MRLTGSRGDTALSILLLLVCVASYSILLIRGGTAGCEVDLIGTRCVTGSSGSSVGYTSRRDVGFVVTESREAVALLCKPIFCGFHLAILHSAIEPRVADRNTFSRKS